MILIKKRRREHEKLIYYKAFCDHCWSTLVFTSDDPYRKGKNPVRYIKCPNCDTEIPEGYVKPGEGVITYFHTTSRWTYNRVMKKETRKNKNNTRKE